METSPPGNFKWIESPFENAYARKETVLTRGPWFHLRLSRRHWNDPFRGLFNAHVSLCNRAGRLVAPVPLVGCAGTYVQWWQTPWRECCFHLGREQFQLSCAV